VGSCGLGNPSVITMCDEQQSLHGVWPAFTEFAAARSSWVFCAFSCAKHAVQMCSSHYGLHGFCRALCFANSSSATASCVKASCTARLALVASSSRCCRMHVWLVIC
jgi:hypothetical protein